MSKVVNHDTDRIRFASYSARVFTRNEGSNYQELQELIKRKNKEDILGEGDNVIIVFADLVFNPDSLKRDLKVLFTIETEAEYDLAIELNQFGTIGDMEIFVGPRYLISSEESFFLEYLASSTKF